MVDKVALRRLSAEIECAETFAAAEVATVELAKLIGHPVIAWSPDVGDPTTIRMWTLSCCATASPGKPKVVGGITPS